MSTLPGSQAERKLAQADLEASICRVNIIIRSSLGLLILSLSLILLFLLLLLFLFSAARKLN